jgi:hypothetical protein
MSGWFNWSNFAAEQVECLLACIIECKEIAAELGRVPDSAILDILEKNVVDTSFFERGSEAKPLEEDPVSFERCVWLNSEGFIASEQRERAAAAREKESKQKRKQFQEKREEAARKKVETQQRREGKAAKKQAQVDSAAISTLHIKRK